MNPTVESVKEALSFVIEPDLKKDIIALDLVSNIQVESNKVSFEVQISNPAMHNRKRMEEACEHHLKRVHGNEIQVEVMANIILNTT